MSVLKVAAGRGCRWRRRGASGCGSRRGRPAVGPPAWTSSTCQASWVQSPPYEARSSTRSVPPQPDRQGPRHRAAELCVSIGIGTVRHVGQHEAASSESSRVGQPRHCEHVGQKPRMCIGRSLHAGERECRGTRACGSPPRYLATPPRLAEVGAAERVPWLSVGPDIGYRGERLSLRSEELHALQLRGSHLSAALVDSRDGSCGGLATCVRGRCRLAGGKPLGEVFEFVDVESLLLC